MTAPSPESRLGHLLDDHLELVSILGVGAYGVVYTAVDIETNTPYAIKALSKLGLDSRQKKFQAREIALHAKAQAHPNIVSLIEILDAPDCVYVVMEYCPEGDLFAVITEHGGYVGDDELARSVFLQLLNAVEYCHQLGIYHRDLKPENVLVCDYGRTIKLADFGLATTEQLTADFGCGSTFYMSPGKLNRPRCHRSQLTTLECQSQAPRRPKYYASAANDIWSLGVMLVNLTCGRNPWKRASASSDETFRAFVKNPNFLASILPLTDEMNYIVQRIFQLDPQKRISLPELRHLIMQCPRFTLSDDEDISEVVEVIRPQTPQDVRVAFDVPITPSTPLHGRAAFYRTKGTVYMPPPTPISPANTKPRAHCDSSSSIASFDSHSSHEQREYGQPPRMAADYLSDPSIKYQNGIPDDIYLNPLQDHKIYHPVPQYVQQYAMA